MAQAPISGDSHAFTCPDFTDHGPADGPPIRVTYESWGTAPAGKSSQDHERADPVVLVHGSPGAGADFARLAQALAAQGRWVLAPDLPGFGHSTRRPDSYSTRAHARAVLALLDHVGARRAHVLGWSMGGGVALHMADLAPDRVASITMLAAIGDQSVEGSGSYAFEHAKYAIGRIGLLAARALAPSFGALPDPRESILFSTLRNFGDTDMRAHRAIMESLQIPTLIIAGRDDFLVQLRAPLLHHQLIRPSRLVVLDAMHFMPFMQPTHTAELVGHFIDHEAPQGPAITRAEVWEVPARRPPLGDIGAAGARAIESLPWWILVAAATALVWRRPFFGVAVVVALVNALAVDWGVGITGVFFGAIGHVLAQLAIGIAHGPDAAGFSQVDWTRRLQHRPAGFWLATRSVFRPDWRTSTPRAVGAIADPLGVVLFAIGCIAGALAWTLVQMLPLLALAALIAQPLRDALGWAGSALSLFLLWTWARSFPLLFTWTGRRVLLARASKIWRHEYWPSWIYYAPLAAYLFLLAARHRHLLAFTACNPGIPRGGGTIGESKQEVLDRLRLPPDASLPSVRIEPGPSPEERAAAALTQVGPARTVGDFPVILKPDAGQRGFAVRLARDEAHVRDYFRSMTRAAVVQRYHPGPGEVGVLWVRDRSAPDARDGFIYSVTRKDFPYVEGDGRRTLEQLIYGHPRHRRQAATFLARLADAASTIPAAGERVRLAQSGNHCQGTLFRDGADLATPELAAALTRLALGDGDDRGIDIGRFDLRFSSEDDLRAGRGFGVIEFNGATGESTNIYDPDRSLLWSWRVLFGQWRLLYEIGAWRRSQGVEAWSLRRLLRELRDFYRNRPGSSVAD